MTIRRLFYLGQLVVLGGMQLWVVTLLIVPWAAIVGEYINQPFVLYGYQTFYIITAMLSGAWFPGQGVPIESVTITTGNIIFALFVLSVVVTALSSGIRRLRHMSPPTQQRDGVSIRRAFFIKSGVTIVGCALAALVSRGQESWPFVYLMLGIFSFTTFGVEALIRYAIIWINRVLPDKAQSLSVKA